MRKLVVITIIIILLSFAINAQDKGKKYSNKEHGYNFTAPSSGWNVSEEEGKCPSITFTNSEQTISIIVSATHSNSLSNYFNKEYQVLELGFTPQGMVQENNGYQAIRLIRNQGGTETALDAFFKPLGENDGVVVMALISGTAYVDDAHRFILQVMKSIKLSFGRKLKKTFSEIEDAYTAQSQQNGSASGAKSENTNNSPLGQLLFGKKLETYKNGTSRIYRLCGGGRFSQNGAELNSSQNGYGSLNTSLTGRWSVQGNTLTLRYNDGTVTSFDLTQGDDKSVIRLDGTSYLMSEADCS